MSCFFPHKLSLPFHQHGTVLATSLIILLALTLIGLTGMQSTGLEQKITANLRDKQFAFQAAEATLKLGENKIRELSDKIAGGGGLNCLPQHNNDGLFHSPDEEPDIDTVWTGTDVLAGDTIPTTPEKFITQYIIECLPGGEGLYRITARSQGASTDAVVILQSVYKYQLSS